MQAILFCCSVLGFRCIPMLFSMVVALLLKHLVDTHPFLFFFQFYGQDLLCVPLVVTGVSFFRFVMLNTRYTCFIVVHVPFSFFKFVCLMDIHFVVLIFLFVFIYCLLIADILLSCHFLYSLVDQFLQLLHAKRLDHFDSSLRLFLCSI